jgi:hypothetical protein
MQYLTISPRGFANETTTYSFDLTQAAERALYERLVAHDAESRDSNGNWRCWPSEGGGALPCCGHPWHQSLG